VLRLGVELPKMRALLQRLAMQSHQNFLDKRRDRSRQKDQRFFVDLVAPTAAFYLLSKRELKTAATSRFLSSHLQDRY
jgi:predicted metal-dependent hydrolase